MRVLIHKVIMLTLSTPYRRFRHALRLRSAITRVLLYCLLTTCMSKNSTAQSYPQSTPITTKQLALGISLLKSEQSSNNRVISPYSVHAALSLVRIGAKGDAAKQLDATLFSAPYSDALLQAYSNLNTKIFSPREGVTTKNGNSLWITKEGAFETSFTNDATRYFSTSTHSIDFSDSERARKTINAWVSERTEAKIPTLIPPGLLTPQSVAALVNALYFKGSWQTAFPNSGTIDDTFQSPTNSRRAIKMMRLTESYPFFENDSWQTVKIPYSGGQFSFLLLLPKRVLTSQEVVSLLSESLISDALKPHPYSRVALQLPRFEIRQSRELTGDLSTFGIGDLFTGRADLSGITKRAFAINAVQHEAFITVDEKGTEAAAATAVIMAKSAAFGREAEPITVRADHPFAFSIVHSESNAPLFLGVIGEP